MSNIPNSAIPHAWAQDDSKETAGAGRTTAARSPSLVTVAGIGAVAYLLYRAVR